MEWGHLIGPALSLVVSLVAVVFGGGKILGEVRAKAVAMDARMDNLESNQKRLRGNGGPSAYVRRDECVAAHALQDRKIEQLVIGVDGLREYAMWYLTNKEGMSLSEAKKVLAGRRGES